MREKVDGWDTCVYDASAALARVVLRKGGDTDAVRGAGSWEAYLALNRPLDTVTEVRGGRGIGGA